MSNITLNIVEPGSPTPDPVVPNTGLFTSGIGGAEAAIIATITLVVVLAIIGAFIYRKKKQGKSPSLFARFKHTKSTTGLAALALLVSIGTVAGLVKLTTSAIEGNEAESTEDSSALTVDVSNSELTIELADEPVFAVLPVELTVAEATEAGYTLTAYTDSTDLVSTTDSSKVIPMIAADEGELVALADNTYGLSLLEPDSETDKVYTVLSTDQSSPTIIRSMPEYTPTEENDTTTIYYGFYITPNTPYGTYTGSDIHYDATINTTLVTFDGNDLYFNNDTEQTTNAVEYIAVPQEESEGTINQIISGEYLEPSQALPYIFLGWSTDQEATVPAYTNEEDIARNLPILPNTPITLYAVWQQATELSFDGNGSDGGEAIDTRTIAAGDTITLPANTFTREGYTFTGWNTEANGEGTAYADKAEFTASLTESENISLYAQWETLPVISDLTEMQDFAKLSEAGKASVLASMTPGQQYQLKDNRDQTMYYIAKLADGNVWMTQNLDLQAENLKRGLLLDSTNTDNPANEFMLPISQVNMTDSNRSWGSNNSQTDIETAHVYDIGASGNVYKYCLDFRFGSCLEEGDEILAVDLGNLYNWYTATAGTGTYTTGSGDDMEATGSICPAGWRLPNNSNNIEATDYSTVLSLYGITESPTSSSYISADKTAIYKDPLSLVPTGDYNNGLFGVGLYGKVWSSLANSDTNAMGFTFNPGDVAPWQNNAKISGQAVRCVAR